MQKVRGRHNPGLPGYTLKMMGVQQENPRGELLAACFFALVIGFLWYRWSRDMRPEEKWVGWLGLTPVVHPLPWWHLFVFSFPLAVTAIDRAWSAMNERSGQRQLSARLPGMLLACGGVFLLAMCTQKLLGPIGQFVENNAGKSWGALACAAALVISTRRKE